MEPERSVGRDAPWCGTRQRSCSSAHSRTCGDRVCEGARVESMESKVERGSRQDPTRDPVGYTRTSTTDEPPRRDVGRHSAITTFLLQPTTKGPTQLTTFLPSFFATSQQTLSLYSEGAVVIYRSPRSGRGLGEADVIVRPDWTGPSWGPPFLGGVSARPGKPAHSTRVWTRQEGIGTFGEAEELEQRTPRFCLEKRASGDSRWTMVCCGQRTEGCKRYGTVDSNGGDIMIY